jgi:cell division protein FtsI (penicillin-binding protein 3)
LDPLPESQAARRLRILTRLAFLWALCILGRLVYVQVWQHGELLRSAQKQQVSHAEVLAPRGRILDRNGQTLAISLPVDSVAINPRRVPDLSVARDLLCPLLNLDPEVLQKRIDWAVTNSKGFLWVKREISREESSKLRGLDLDWVEFRRESRRSYPKASLAANVIGCVDHEESGNSGVEMSLDADLRGKPGLVRTLTDARRQGVDSQTYIEAAAGRDIALTIDERIQFVADREIRKAVEEHGCETGSLIVMDPHSGEILALSSYPTFDPNEPAKSKEDLEARANLAVSIPFEPGSVFKVITLAAALETTHLTPETAIDCRSGVMNLSGRRIHDTHAYETLTLVDVLAKSSNIGAIQVALEIGEERLLEYVRRFGFGGKTGVPLPAESAGKVRDLDEWTRTSIASVAMGHEISATTLQLALATSVIANGGLLPEPRLILWGRELAGETEIAPQARSRRVIKPETAIAMRRMMEAVVLHGTGKRARLNGYTAGGKTGTAQIFDFETGRYSHRYNSSFAGFAPVANPAIVVGVTLNGATQYGGVVSAPVFREVATAALRILGVVKDLPDDAVLPPDEPAEVNDLAIAELGTPLPPLEEEHDVTERQVSPYLYGPRVPDFRGKSLRAVLEESSRAGMKVEYAGSGIARAQHPPPGAVLAAGERVQVQFAR